MVCSLFITREMLEKTHPQNIARRKAQLSPEEIQALADQGRAKTAATTPPANLVAMTRQEKVCGVCCFGLIAFVSEHFCKYFCTYVQCICKENEEL